MNNSPDHIVVLVTAKDAEEAKKIAAHLVEARLAACVNIVPGARSIFWWDNKVDEANEALLVIKSRQDCFQKIVEAVKSVHSYDVPEIIALPIIAGQQDYLNWINESVNEGKG